MLSPVTKHFSIRYLWILIAIVGVMSPAGCNQTERATKNLRVFKLIEHPEAFVEGGFDYDDVAGELGIHGDSRRGFYMGWARSIAFEVPAPGTGVLKFAYGFGPKAHRDSGIIRISVHIEKDGERISMGEWETDPRSKGAQDQWFEAAARWPEGVTGDAKLTFTLDGLLLDAPQETFFLAHPAIVSERVPGERTRVILINVTALRADHLGCYGYERKTSANIDAFASEGFLLENCIATSSWTFPSAASMLTGHFLDHSTNSGEQWTLNEGIDYLPEMLSQRGISTVSLYNSKWLGVETGMHRGFDRCQHFVNKHANDLLNVAEEWLSMHVDEDVFAFINLAQTGLPYLAPLPYRESFDPEYDGDFKYFYIEQAFDWGGEVELTEDVKEHLKALYDEEILALDDAFGDFLTFLKSSGYYDTSLIIFTGLNGEELFEHGGLGQGHQLYGETLHIPMIIHGDGFPGGSDESLCSPMDIFPTILSWLALDVPAEIAGIALSDSHGDETVTDRMIIAGQLINGPEKRSVTTLRYHYIYNTVDGTEELYDMEADTMMLHDIAGENPGVVAELREVLAARTGEM